MTAPSLDPILVLTARASLALLFATTTVHKLSDLRSFVGAVRAYRLVPAASAPLVAALLTAAEAAIAVALLVTPVARPAALAAATLLVLYSAAIAVNLARGRTDMDCGCGGPAARQPLDAVLLARNGALLCGALLACASGGDRDLVWFDFVSLVGTVISAAAIWHAVNRMLSIHGVARTREALQ